MEITTGHVITALGGENRPERELAAALGVVERSVWNWRRQGYFSVRYRDQLRALAKKRRMTIPDHLFSTKWPGRPRTIPAARKGKANGNAGVAAG